MKESKVTTPCSIHHRSGTADLAMTDLADRPNKLINYSEKKKNILTYLGILSAEFWSKWLLSSPMEREITRNTSRCVCAADLHFMSHLGGK